MLIPLYGPLMGHLHQADGLQGPDVVGQQVPAANDLGMGLGWKQSRQNQVPLAVVKILARSAKSVESAHSSMQLQLFS